MKKSLGAHTWALPTPVWLIGSYDKEGKPNVMAAAWGGICCSRPPCIQVSLREATYTHSAITKRNAFTVNIPGEEYWREADYVGVVSGRDTDKFTDCGFTATKSELVDAPLIDECSVNIECRLKKTLNLGLHTMFVGEILDIKADDCVVKDGAIDIQRVKPILFSPPDEEYHSIGSKIADAFQQKTPP